MEIRNVKKLKSGKYKINFNNNSKIITYDDVIINNNLLYKKNIDNKLLDDINVQTSYYDTYSKIVKYIAIRMRSKKEIIKYLDKNKVEESDKNKIIQDLLKTGLINDEMFAKAFISDKTYLSNIGRIKIKNELLEHNIDENLIDEIIYSYDDVIFEEKLKKLMTKKVNLSNYSGQILKQKIFYEFNNLGYETDLIQKVYNNINKPNNINKDFEKYYNTLSKKYSDSELIIKLKNKLYSRGYSTDEINEVINNIK